MPRRRNRAMISGDATPSLHVRRCFASLCRPCRTWWRAEDLSPDVVTAVEVVATLGHTDESRSNPPRLAAASRSASVALTADFSGLMAALSIRRIHAIWTSLRFFIGHRGIHSGANWQNYFARTSTFSDAPMTPRRARPSSFSSAARHGTSWKPSPSSIMANRPEASVTRCR